MTTCLTDFAYDMQPCCAFLMYMQATMIRFVSGDERIATTTGQAWALKTNPDKAHSHMSTSMHWSSTVAERLLRSARF